MSEDGEVGYLYFVFNFGENGWTDIPAAADEVRDIAQIDGVTVHLAGYGGQAADSAEAFEGIDTNLILATLLVVIVILLLTYRSPTLWLLPIISAVFAYMTSAGVVYLLAKYADLTVNGQSQAILGILVIGAGTDYALLLVARYREELRRHEDRHEAMAFALHRAAPAILASSATVVVSMLCLSFAELNSTAGMGPVLAVGIAVTFLVMVTLLPALLVICGRWIFWPKRPAFGSPEPTSTGFWARVGNRIAPNPRKVWLITAGLLAIACLGLFRLDPSGLSTEDTYTKEFDSIKGQQVLTEHGLADSSNTIQVVANTDALPQVQDALAGIDGLGEARPAQDLGSGRSYFEATINADISSPAAFDIVESSREAVHEVDGADALVGGGAAFYLDTKVASNRDNKVIIPIVLVVVFLILVGLLRAVAAPLILIGTVVLSFGAALGISALLFEYVFGFAGSDPGFPLFAFVFLVALGIDYNIFLMTRVREETQTFGTRRGSLIALSSTGGVITSAGPGAGGDVPGARLDPGGVPRRDRGRGRPRRDARHVDRAVGAGHRASTSTSAARSGGRASSTVATPSATFPSQAGGGAGPLTDASTPPPAYPEASGGVDVRGQRAAPAVGAVRSASARALPWAHRRGVLLGAGGRLLEHPPRRHPRRRLVLRVRVRPCRSRSPDHHRVAAAAPHRRQPRLLEPRVR